MGWFCPPAPPQSCAPAAIHVPAAAGDGGRVHAAPGSSSGRRSGLAATTRPRQLRCVHAACAASFMPSHKHSDDVAAHWLLRPPACCSLLPSSSWCFSSRLFQSCTQTMRACPVHQRRRAAQPPVLLHHLSLNHQLVRVPALCLNIADRSDPMRDCILLCACGEAELLPQNPDLPADTFTSCLTTPIKVCARPLPLGFFSVFLLCVLGLISSPADKRPPSWSYGWAGTATRSLPAISRSFLHPGRCEIPCLCFSHCHSWYH
jgi:hypothetical protein